MRKRNKKESTLNRILEIPQEISTNEPKITISGFKRMLIENYKVILEYQDIYIRIKTYIGIVNITGFNLKLGEMTDDDIIVTGNIETVDFEKIESFKYVTIKLDSIISEDPKKVIEYINQYRVKEGKWKLTQGSKEMQGI